MSSFAFSQIQPSRRVPGQTFEFDSSRAGYFQVLTKVLLIGARLPSGTVPAGVLERVRGADQAKVQFGRGSMLARMVELYRRNDPNSELWCLAVDDVAALPANLTIDNLDIPIDYEGAVMPAVGRVDFMGSAAAASGIIHLYIAGQRVRIGVTKGDGPAQIARKAKIAVNQGLDLPVTASSDDTGIVLTSRHRGEVCNQIDLRLNYLGAALGERTPDGVQVAITAMAGGAGDPSMLSVAPLITDEKWAAIITPYTDGDAGAVLAEEMLRRWHADTQVYGVVIGARVGRLNDLLAFGPTNNSPYMSIMGIPGCPSPPWEIAPAYGGQVANSAAIDPARPFQTLPLVGIAAPALTDRLKTVDANALLYAGVATAMVEGGYVRIQREITTYRVNEWGEIDPSYLDLNTPLTLSLYIQSLRQWIALKFPRAKLANDGTRVRPGSVTVTPSILKSEVIAHYAVMERLGLMENMAAFVENLVVERDETDPNRANFLLPPDLVNQLRLVAGVVQFRLQF